MALTLVIATRITRHGRFRPWIAMKVAGIPFDEVVISLDATDFKPRVSKIFRHRKVPALDDSGIHVWESLRSLNISPNAFRNETLAGRSGGAGTCPGDLVGNARRFRAAASRLPDEHVAPGQEARTERGGARQRPPHPGYVGRVPRTVMEPAGRSCSARSAPPTPCMPRWSRAFTPTTSKSTPRRAPTWALSWRCRHGLNGGEPP